MKPFSASKASARYLLVGLSFLCGVVFTVLLVQLFGKVHPSPPPSSAPITTAKPESDSAPADDAPEPSPAVLPPILENRMAFEPVEDDLRSEPIPLEWEGPLFAVLEMEDMDRRNLGLIQLATVTAKNVPRVQAECLAHLTFALEEKDHAQLLLLLRDRRLPLQSRLQFLKETFEIRRPEFSEWLAKNLASDPQPEISLAAQRFLTEYNSRQATGGLAPDSAGAF